MRIRKITGVLLLLCLMSGCGSESFNNTIAQLTGDISKLKEDTTYRNEYFGMTFTIPKDWWIYDINGPAFEDGLSGDPAQWARAEFEGAQEYYIDLIHIGSRRDTNYFDHSAFMIFVENFPDMESLETFANLTAIIYESIEDGYTTTNYGMEPLTHNGTLYYRADFETTHPDNETSILSHYYVCQVQGLFITIYFNYWEGEAEAKKAAEAIFDSLTITKGAMPDN